MLNQLTRRTSILGIVAVGLAIGCVLAFRLTRRSAADRDDETSDGNVEALHGAVVVDGVSSVAEASR